MRHHSSIHWLLVVGILLGAREASATVILPADFQTVVMESTLIVHGRVVSVQAGLTAPSRAIESVVGVQVIERLKGRADDIVYFRVPNGQVGRYRRVLAGAPEFAVGDEVVLFLQGRPPAMPMVFGLSQGLYRVARGTGAGPVVLPPRTAAGTAGRVVRGDPAHAPLPIEVFTRQVKLVMGQAR